MSGAAWREPGADIVDIVDAQPLPGLSLSPDGRWLVLLEREARPPLAVLARPFERLAGLRIDPQRGARRALEHYRGLVRLDPGSGAEQRVELEDEVRIAAARWSPDGRRLAFSVARDDGLELRVLELESARASRVELGGGRINDVLGGCGFRWLDSARLLVELRSGAAADAPPRPPVPAGPRVQETRGRAATNRTWQDLLEDAHDEALFEHHATSRLVLVSAAGTAGPLPIGEPGLLRSVQPSPDGTRLLVERLVRPFSRLVPYLYFARRVEVWGLSGEVEHVLAADPPAEEIPIQGVRTGPRYAHWQPHRGAALVWVEALDGGDPNREAAHRDRILRLAAPFEGEPEELLRTPERFSGADWLELDEQLLVSDYDRDRKWLTTRLHALDRPDAEPRVVFDRARLDRYGDPGEPVYVTRPDGTSVVRVEDGGIYLSGDGASPQGDRPFLDWMSLASLEKRRLHQSALEPWSRFAGFVESAAAGPDTRPLLLRTEAPAQPPNYVVLERPSGRVRPLTRFPDPHPQLTGVRKEVVAYTRADGVALSGTLYLPPGAPPGPLPMLVWAYPREHADATTASQVSAQPGRFARLEGTSPLMLLARGVAVLVAQMPIVGDPGTVNDTFVAQVVDNARAAVAAMVARGVADPARIVVGGHSYGAFMVAHLLAHTELFCAGIARSGAYNRTLTPFGFQNERRTLWQAPQAYVEVSPLFVADRIARPLLLVHGEADSNPGTWSMQSERLYHALQGLGATARLVVLPHESHSYQARESVLHVLAEMLDWFERHAGGAPGIDEAGAVP